MTTNPVILEGRTHDDLAIVQRSLLGDDAAQALLVARLSCVSKILHSLNERMGNRLQDQDLADLSQDTLLVILGKLSIFEGRGRIESWAYRFCFLEYMNRIRRHIRWSKLAGTQLESVSDLVAHPQESSFLELDDLETRIRELVPPEDQVIRLKHLEQRTFKEIAKKLDLSPNSVKTYYYRGLTRLRKRFQLLRNEQEG